MAVLQSVLESGADAQAALDTALSRSLPANTQAHHDADSRLCTELVYGTLRNSLRLHWFLQRFLPNPEKLPLTMRLALQAACHELFHMRVPEYATVDAYVGLVKARFGTSLGNVANGVLRNVLRNQHEYFSLSFYEAAWSDHLAALACFHSCPEWLARLWAEHYGEAQAVQYMEASSLPAPAGLRLNPARLCNENALLTDLAAKALLRADGKGQLLPPLTAKEDAAPLISEKNFQESAHTIRHLAFDRALPPEAGPLLDAGMASRQSGASFQALFALRPETWGGPLWDCCAGRGGKTLALMEAGIPVALCSDISASRLKGLAADLRRIFGPDQGFGPVICHHAADKPLARETLSLLACEGFGAVLVDAPCSGFGTLARHPEIRLRRTLTDVEKLVALQGRILHETAKSVKKGGVLVYMTCTVTPSENDGQVAAFLQKHPEFKQEREFTTPADTPYREFFFGVVLRKGQA